MASNEWQRAYRQRIAAEGRCTSCSRRHSETTKMCDLCKRKKQIKARAEGPGIRARLKTEALNAYGNGLCACCGEPDERFLTLDHVNNDGAEHRRSLSIWGQSMGSVFYRRMKSLGYPNDPPLQVLCFNCNNGKRVNKGVCPHQEVVLNG